MLKRVEILAFVVEDFSPSLTVSCASLLKSSIATCILPTTCVRSRRKLGSWSGVFAGLVWGAAGGAVAALPTLPGAAEAYIGGGVMGTDAPLFGVGAG